MEDHGDLAGKLLVGITGFKVQDFRVIGIITKTFSPANNNKPTPPLIPDTLIILPFYHGWGQVSGFSVGIKGELTRQDATVLWLFLPRLLVLVAISHITTNTITAIRY